MIQQEMQWDKLLKIKTTGRDDSNADQYRYPYEPTPYSVLERLANSGYLGKKNTLLDYGCGKGRVDFFLSWQTRCRAIGIEYDERIFAVAEANQKTAISGKRTTFSDADAETYQVPPEVDRCYFFNPFSIELFQKVLVRIYEARMRQYEQEIVSEEGYLLFFYYPSDEYVAYLMTQEQLLFVDEIDCMDLFPGEDEREKILIFEVL